MLSFFYIEEEILMGKGADLRQDGVKITLDKERTLLFDLNTLVDLEEEYGDIEVAFEGLSSGKMKPTRKLLWIALKHEDENLTEMEVGKLIPLNKVGEIATKLKETLTVSIPESNEKN